MPAASFMQTSFLGGVWSSYSQGRMDSERYKSGMNVCLNSYPLEEGSWTRRQGTGWIATTKEGGPARVVSFDFSVARPYHLELGEEYLRAFVGRTHVFTADEQDIDSITTATPAVVTTDSSHGWATGDTVMFIFTEQSDTLNMVVTRNRQFIITVTAVDKFSIADAITGESIVGSTLDYTPGSGEVKRILELDTPYELDGAVQEWDAVRKVQSEDQIILLHGLYIPQIVEEDASEFTIEDADFIDGPYLDPANDGSFLTPSGVTGSITLAFDYNAYSAGTNYKKGARVASVGVNYQALVNNNIAHTPASSPTFWEVIANGFSISPTGFDSTDVGRLIRLHNEPATWASASTYAAGASVKYNENYYVALTAVAAAQPAPDKNFTAWSLDVDASMWTWGRITAVGGDESVTFQILGDDLPNTNNISEYRLGLFSDTTGWPTVGAIYEGRLWLGGVRANRVDGSTTRDNFFDFSPTSKDGTVADDNAVAAIAASENRNKTVWMAAREEGLIVGTEGGEWRIRASATDDPLSPSNVQFRKITGYKCYDAEPVRAQKRHLFIQRQQRKVMEFEYGPTGFSASNIALTARNLTFDGLEELAFQAEPVPTLWARRSDGALIGCAYKHDEELNYAGWHNHALGLGRTVESISVGASLDGLTENLWLVTAGNGVRFIEALTDVFEDDDDDFAALFVDSAITPAGAEVDGDDVIFHGLWPLNGTTVSVFAGTLDLGDFEVADGAITVPFDDNFTAAYLSALTFSGQDFGGLAVNIDIGNAPAIPPSSANVGSIIAYVPSYTDLVDMNGSTILFDWTRGRHFTFDGGPGWDAGAGIRSMESDTTGEELLEADVEHVYGTGGDKGVDTGIGGGGAAIEADGGFLYLVSITGNRCQIAKIDAQTLEYEASFGSYAALPVASGNNGILYPRSMVHLRRNTGSQFLVSTNVTSLTTSQEVTVINTETMGWGGFIGTIDEDIGVVCRGGISVGTVQAFVLGKEIYAPTSSTPIGLYRVDIDAGAQNYDPTTWPGVANPNISMTKIGTKSPAQIDATWTVFSNVYGIAYDEDDGHVLIVCQTNEAVTNKTYLVKLHATTAAVVWKRAIESFSASDDGKMNRSRIDGRYAFISPLTSGGDRKVYVINTATGAVESEDAWKGIGDLAGAQAWDTATGSITAYLTFTENGTPPLNSFGDYLGSAFDAHASFTSEWARIYPAAAAGSGAGSETLYNSIPVAIGYTYTSRGQLLRPDYGNDAGAANGPAFGKTRRPHQYAAALHRCRGISVGVDFSTLRAVPLKDAGGTDIEIASYFTGTVQGTIDAPYDLDGKIAWEITRPYPATVLAVGGFLSTQDR